MMHCSPIKSGGLTTDAPMDDNIAQALPCRRSRRIWYTAECGGRLAEHFPFGRDHYVGSKRGQRISAAFWSTVQRIAKVHVRTAFLLVDQSEAIRQLCHRIAAEMNSIH